MRRRLGITISAFFVVAGLASAVLVAQARNGSGGPQSARKFIGYWMGIDPLDGGDARRGITANDDGTFSMIGHDSVLTLCGGTDRGIIRVDDFTAVGSATLVSDNHVLTCTNNGRTITLRNRTELIDKNIIRETVTGDNFFDETIYHRVSER